jgi:predicted amidohydrolase
MVTCEDHQTPARSCSKALRLFCHRAGCDCICFPKGDPGSPRFLDIELRLATLRVLECSVHDQDDGEPGDCETFANLRTLSAFAPF